MIWYIIWYNIWYIIWYNIWYIILYYIILCYIIFFCSLLFIYCIIYIIVYMMHDIWYDTWYMIEATKIFGISNQQDTGSRLPWCHASGALVVPEDVSEVAAAPGESPLLQLCCTPCQEKALRAILEAVSSKSSGCHLAVHKTSVFAFDFWDFILSGSHTKLIQKKMVTKKLCGLLSFKSPFTLWSPCGFVSNWAQFWCFIIIST